LKHEKIRRTEDNSVYVGVKFIFDKENLGKHLTFETRLKIHLSMESLPKFSDNWHYGDIHYHSEFTNNLTEFGGPMRFAKIAGMAFGLSWVAVTDHSCDLTRDKFKRMKVHAQNLSKDHKFIFIPSEEITVKKEKRKLKPIDYLHLLSHDAQFIRGTFFGTHSLSSVFGFMSRNTESFSFAAHPTVFKIDWEEKDGDYETALPHSQFYGLQIFNAKIKKACKIESPHLINPFGDSGEFRHNRHLIKLFSNYERE